MKRIAFIILWLLQLNFCFAQGAFTNTTHSALQQVLTDYSSSFSNIRGQLVQENVFPKRYLSTVSIPGSAASYVLHYGDLKTSGFGWQCILVESGDFSIATTIFEKAFREISNSIIHIEGQKPYILNGAYTKPSEQNDLQSIRFRLLPSLGNLQKVAVELVLRKTASDWKVFVHVYENDGKGLYALSGSF